MKKTVASLMLGMLLMLGVGTIVVLSSPGQAEAVTCPSGSYPVWIPGHGWSCR